MNGALSPSARGLFSDAVGGIKGPRNRLPARTCAFIHARGMQACIRGGLTRHEVSRHYARDKEFLLASFAGVTELTGARETNCRTAKK